VGLCQADGRAYGVNAAVYPEWQDVRVPLGTLRPLWRTKTGKPDLAQLRQVSFVFGAWLYGSRRGDAHGYEVESVWLEHVPPRWEIDVRAPGGPVDVFLAGRHLVRPTGHTKGASYRLIRGRTPGCVAQRVAAKGFGPAPSCLSFRCNPGREIDPWRSDLAAHDAVKLVARAGEPDTNRLEMVLVEADGAPWGTVVDLTPEWREIVLPFGELRFFKHWSHPKDRGGEGDRLHPERVQAVKFCFGAWLFGDCAARPHAVEIERVSLVKLTD